MIFINDNKNLLTGLIVVLLVLVAVITISIFYFNEKENEDFNSTDSSSEYLQENSEEESSSANVYGEVSSEEEVSSDIDTSSGIIEEYLYLDLSEERFYYSQLEPIYQEFYKEILIGLLSLELDFTFDERYIDADITQLNETFWLVLDDYPEIFWLNYHCNYSYKTVEETSYMTKLSVESYLTNDEIYYYIELINEETSQIIANAENLNSDYEIALYLYEYLANNLEYNFIDYDKWLNNITYKTKTSSNIQGALVYNNVICGGYSKAYDYLLSLFGIEAFYVSGYTDESSGSSHAWNIIKLDDNYYHVDITWGDSELEDFLDYKYFCIDTETISANHTLTEDYDFPTCNSTDYNYYVENNLYFESYNYSMVNTLVDQTLANGNTSFTMIYANLEAFEAAQASLIDNYEIWNTVTEYQQSYNISYRAYEHDLGEYVFTIIFSEK